jgi:hypothetical protein
MYLGRCFMNDERVVGELWARFKEDPTLHLERVLREYVRYFNSDRPHQGHGQKAPLGAAEPPNPKGMVVSTPVLRGLHYAYRRAA